MLGPGVAGLGEASCALVVIVIVIAEEEVEGEEEEKEEEEEEEDIDEDNVEGETSVFRLFMSEISVLSLSVAWDAVDTRIPLSTPGDVEKGIKSPLSASSNSFIIGGG